MSNKKRFLIKSVLMLSGAVLMLGIISVAQADCGMPHGYYGNSSGYYGNRYGTDDNSLKLYSPNGRFLGNLNDNRYDSNSVSNPYGQYGSKYSRDSINNRWPYWLYE